MTILVCAASLVAVPWKNGGGVTREIAAGPAGASLNDFAWRLSIADVADEGAFSVFAGIDRVLVLLDGAGMRLHEAQGAVHALDMPLAMARFAGETPIHATLTRGPTRDFNVMTRRDKARATVHAYAETRALDIDHDAACFFCARGSLDVALARGERIALDEGDTLIVERSAERAVCEAREDASWLHIGIDMLGGDTR